MPRSPMGARQMAVKGTLRGRRCWFCDSCGSWNMKVCRVLLKGLKELQPEHLEEGICNTNLFYCVFSSHIWCSWVILTPIYSNLLSSPKWEMGGREACLFSEVFYIKRRYHRGSYQDGRVLNCFSLLKLDKTPMILILGKWYIHYKQENCLLYTDIKLCVYLRGFVYFHKTLLIRTFFHLCFLSKEA